MLPQREQEERDDEKKSGQESLLESGLKKSLIKPLESMKKKAAGPLIDYSRQWKRCLWVPQHQRSRCFGSMDERR